MGAMPKCGEVLMVPTPVTRGLRAAGAASAGGDVPIAEARGTTSLRLETFELERVSRVGEAGVGVALTGSQVNPPRAPLAPRPAVPAALAGRRPPASEFDCSSMKHSRWPDSGGLRWLVVPLRGAGFSGPKRVDAEPRAVRPRPDRRPMLFCALCTSPPCLVREPRVLTDVSRMMFYPCGCPATSNSRSQAIIVVHRSPTRSPLWLCLVHRLTLTFPRLSAASGLDPPLYFPFKIDDFAFNFEKGAPRDAANPKPR